MKDIIKSNETVELICSTETIVVHNLQLYTKHGYEIKEKKKNGWLAVAVSDGKGKHSTLFNLNKKQAFKMAFSLLDAVRIFEDYEKEEV